VGLGRSVAILLALAPACLEAADAVEYLRDVKPILAANCYACHGAKVQMMGLRLDTAAAMLGARTRVVVPGNSAESRIIHAVLGAEGVTRMPQQKPPLSAQQIALLKAWIDQGAKAPASEPADSGNSGRTHWSFVAPNRPAHPAVKNRTWARNGIDLFILDRLEREGITPAAEADRTTLIRRVSLDLVGLLPSVEEVGAFVLDTRRDAYERLVDRLLASPHYGERWGRHWLDLARYADSNGYSIDSAREIWKYRDWVIDALNRDMPFNQFAIEQIAGDMLPNATTEQKIATGFHRNTPFNQEGGIDREQFRVDYVADRVATTGSVFLGLSLGCARCHDHKFDPISQREYYQMFAFLNNADEPVLELASPEEIAKRNSIRAQFRTLEGEFEGLQREWLKKLPEENRRQLSAEILTILALSAGQRDDRQKEVLWKFFMDQGADFRERILAVMKLKNEEPKIPTVLVMQELAKPRESYVHVGGDFTRKGERVSPGVPRVLHALPAIDSPNRLHLARWIADAKNPLIGRVTVNRMWQQYFGTGLVETENDFGTQGSLPTHPELLDWLATEFVGRNWSQKAMHRLIVTSSTYRQASRLRPELSDKDPYNRMLARQNRIRLEAEIIRDAALSASGLLNLTIGGPSVFPPQPDGVFSFTQIPRTWTVSTGADRYRRGMYTHFWRSAGYPALLVFDAPDAITTCTRRIRSNTPLQALTLLNDQAFVELAQALAARVLKERLDDRERLDYAFRLCLSRPPGDAERERLEQFLKQQLQEFRGGPDASRAAWTAVSRVLMNLDEFITRE
jgi:hypothetical protein